MRLVKDVAIEIVMTRVATLQLVDPLSLTYRVRKGLRVVAAFDKNGFGEWIEVVFSPSRDGTIALHHTPYRAHEMVALCEEVTSPLLTERLRTRAALVDKCSAQDGESGDLMREAAAEIERLVQREAAKEDA